jgi:predicted DNA-binding WGR domain protein
MNGLRGMGYHLNQLLRGNNMSKVLETVKLCFKDSKSDKFYVASIERDGQVNGENSYSVPVTWGRTGTVGQAGYKAQGVSHEDAKKAYEKVVQEKMKKGYELSQD